LAGIEGQSVRNASLRGNSVLAVADGDGAILVSGDGRVPIRYKPGGSVYLARLENLAWDGGASPTIRRTGESAAALKARLDEAAGAAAQAGGNGAKSDPRAAVHNGRVGPARTEVRTRIYADGACVGNPGPCGAGVAWFERGRLVRERGEFLGRGTNNVGELVAILRAVESVPADESPVDILTDSLYAIDVVSGRKRAKANAELVASVQAALTSRPGIRLVKVKGHSGEPGNELADKLANDAVAARKTFDSETG